MKFKNELNLDLKNYFDIYFLFLVYFNNDLISDLKLNWIRYFSWRLN